MAKENDKSKAPQGVCSTKLLDSPFCGATPAKEPDTRGGRSYDYYIKIDHKKDCMICGINKRPRGSTPPDCCAFELAVKFHETYERLAPSFGYETRAETKTFNPDSNNGKLMIAVCKDLLMHNVSGEQTLGAISPRKD